MRRDSPGECRFVGEPDAADELINARNAANEQQSMHPLAFELLTSQEEV